MKIDLTNVQDCFKSISNLGSTTYINICTGTKEIVPWGLGDWIVIVFFGIILVGIIGFIIYMIFDSF